MQATLIKLSRSYWKKDREMRGLFIGNGGGFSKRGGRRRKIRKTMEIRRLDEPAKQLKILCLVD